MNKVIYRDKKRYIIIILILFMCLLVNLGTLYFWYHLKVDINNIVLEQENNRTLTIFTSNIDDISNDYIESIKAVYNNQVISIEDNNYNVNVRESLSNDEVCVSLYISKKLNKSSLVIDNKEYIIKDILNDNSADIYVSEEEFRNLFKVDANEYQVIVSESTKKSEVISYLESKNISVVVDSEGVGVEIEYLSRNEMIMKVLVIIVLIINMIIFKNIVYSILNMEKKNIAIYRIIGYLRKYILFMVVKRIVLLLLISDILVSLLFIILGIYVVKLNIFMLLCMLLFIGLLIPRLNRKIKNIDIFGVLE